MSVEEQVTALLSVSQMLARVLLAQRECGLPEALDVEGYLPSALSGRTSSGVTVYLESAVAFEQWRLAVGDRAPSSQPGGDGTYVLMNAHGQLAGVDVRVWARAEIGSAFSAETVAALEQVAQ